MENGLNIGNCLLFEKVSLPTDDGIDIGNYAVAIEKEKPVVHVSSSSARFPNRPQLVK